MFCFLVCDFVHNFLLIRLPLQLSYCPLMISILSRVVYKYTDKCRHFAMFEAEFSTFWLLSLITSLNFGRSENCLLNF